MDHDRLFKELLINFFSEFIELFLPNVSAYMDKEATIVPLDKEIFTDVTLGNRHEVDLLMKVKFKSQDAFFLIHVENQSSSQSDFPKRMFKYFSRLTDKYDLPVYPVVIFSYDSPARQEPKQYLVVFPDKVVLKFDYTVIQLNRIPWRRYVHKANPVASALMAKMKMEAKDRPRVKLECLRLLASLKLDPARSKLIGGFIDSYLILTAQEMKQYEYAYTKLSEVERKETMALISSWEQKGIDKGMAQGMAQGITQGIAQGITQGKEGIISRQAQRRFYPDGIPGHIKDAIKQLSSDRLDDLSEAILDLNSASEFEQWLST